MENNEELSYKNTLNQVCTTLDLAIENSNIQNKELRQKLFALSSFPEFLKSGADVETNGINNNVAEFKIILKSAPRQE